MPKPDLEEVIHDYLDRNNIHSFEGERGVRRFEQFIKVLGYDTIEAFLIDNPGVYDVIIDWIADHGDNEWRDNLLGKIAE